MSFLNIEDPKKRDAIVKEYLQTKRNIQQDFLNERMGEMNVQRDLSKIFQPVIEKQEELISGQKAITEGIQAIPQAITYPPQQQIPSITAPEEQKIPDPSIIGPTATQYLQKFMTKNPDVDKTWGLHSKYGNFYVGDKQVTIVDDDIYVNLGDDSDPKIFEGTPGLWELLVSKKPNKDLYNEDDYKKYAELMFLTNSIRYNNNPKSEASKSSKGWKWKNLMKQIWADRKKYEGQGLEKETVVIPSDPNALAERFDLLMASKSAGNTGVRNELVSICDELLRQNAIDKTQYKELISHI